MCGDPFKIATFWAEVTGLRHHPDNRPGEQECALLSGADIIEGGMLFQRPAEVQVVSNRLHLDLQPTDRSRDEEVERLLGRGAERGGVGRDGRLTPGGRASDE